MAWLGIQWYGGGIEVCMIIRWYCWGLQPCDSEVGQIMSPKTTTIMSKIWKIMSIFHKLCPKSRIISTYPDPQKKGQKRQSPKITQCVAFILWWGYICALGNTSQTCWRGWFISNHTDGNENLHKQNWTSNSYWQFKLHTPTVNLHTTKKYVCVSLTPITGIISIHEWSKSSFVAPCFFDDGGYFHLGSINDVESFPGRGVGVFERARQLCLTFSWTARFSQ